LMMSLWDALRMNMMISYQELVRTFPKLQCQILGEGIGFLPDYMVREAMEKSLLVTRQIHNPRQDSRMLLATRHSASGQVTQWIKREFSLQGILTGIYQDLMHRA
ncbi:hypothetical protein MQA30_25700, partial [Escherichia coli]|nr:hypothetical protein [Escherichia coli]